MSALDDVALEYQTLVEAGRSGAMPLNSRDGLVRAASLILQSIDLMDQEAQRAELDSWTKHFQTEVHLAYQRMGSKLRNTVRQKNNISSSSTGFSVMGHPSKSVTVYLDDRRAGDWVDAFEEIRLRTNERRVVVNAGAYALGRTTDKLIIGSLECVSDERDAPSPETGLTKDKVVAAHEMLNEAGTPDDGGRYAIVGWRQWSDLLGIEEFSNRDYLGEDDLPWKGTQAKRWMNTIWMPHSGLVQIDDIRHCYWYHRSALGHAIGDEVVSDISWHGDRGSHFVNHLMAQGAGILDQSRIVRMPCAE